MRLNHVTQSLSKVRWLRPSAPLLGAFILMLSILPARAVISDVLESIRESEFRFARQGSEVPFVPMSWVQDRFYPNTDFKHPDSSGSDVNFDENVISQGLLYPAYVAKSDMLLLGECLSYDNVNVESGHYPDQRVVTVTPVLAWLRQLNENNLAAAFAAPMFSKPTTGGGEWGTKCFAGLVAMYWSSETFQWVYGGVYEYSFGRNYIYPYGGFIWAPAPKWSVAMIFPWPTVAYAPTDRWLLSVGAAPGGSAWVETSSGLQTTYSFYTWTLSAGAAWRFYKKLWLYVGVGVSGLRSFDVNVSGNSKVVETKPGSVFTIAIQFRP